MPKPSILMLKIQFSSVHTSRCSVPSLYRLHTVMVLYTNDVLHVDFLELHPLIAGAMGQLDLSS